MNVNKKHILTTFTLLINLLVVHRGFGQQKEVSFSRSYIKENDQKVTIEINEVQELIYVILSITGNGKNNPNMVNQKTEYYAEVNRHFSPYTHHEIVVKFDTLLSESLIQYFILAGNAFGYKFSGDHIVPTGVYNFPAKGVGQFEVKTNPIATYIRQLEDFAKKSSFRKFYREHKDYYNALKTEYSGYAAIDEQKKWLEERFHYKINSYRVLTSPLIGGMNATHMFEDNNFREILLFLPAIKKDKAWTEQISKAVNTRVIFTEIDHNYVGPVSQKNLSKIDTIFSKRDKWVNAENKSTDHYPNALKVFDEYLTWGLFILYAQDKFSEDQAVFNHVVADVNSMMIKKGFPKAKEFNEYLLHRYQQSEDKHIEQLYPPLLDWSAQQ